MSGDESVEPPTLSAAHEGRGGRVYAGSGAWFGVKVFSGRVFGIRGYGDRATASLPGDKKHTRSCAQTLS